MKETIDEVIKKSVSKNLIDFYYIYDEESNTYEKIISIEDYYINSFKVKTIDNFDIERQRIIDGSSILTKTYCSTGREEEKNRDVHTEHCCEVHGCKYRDDNCTVYTGKKKSSGFCEDCGLTDEGYYD